MPYQNISVELTPQEFQSIKDAIAAVRGKLSFLQSLTKDERVKRFKMGPKRLAWVQECLAAARNNPDALPRAFKVDEFSKDLSLTAALSELRTIVGQLYGDLDDTTMNGAGGRNGGGHVSYSDRVMLRGTEI